MAFSVPKQHLANCLKLCFGTSAQFVSLLPSITHALWMYKYPPDFCACLGAYALARQLCT